MGSLYSGCYECGTNCIEDQFCGDATQISLPKNIKIKIVANPAFWGFDDGSGNVLIEGWSTFSKGHYDFFDGFDENHTAFKTCNGTTVGPFANEQRPDVLYRTVYDPEDPSLDAYSGRRHYGADGAISNIDVGGAEVYLVDRPKGLIEAVTSDNESCDDTNPSQVYKKIPENFGFGNKISTTDKVFQNITGAWRFVSLSGCYDNYYVDSGIVSECDGTPKQHINYGPNFTTEYDPFQMRASGDRGCLPDGSIPHAYQSATGILTESGLYRDSSGSFITLRFNYNNKPASGVLDGDSIGIDIPGFNGAYTVFNVEHFDTYTSANLVGTVSDNIFTHTFNSGEFGGWVLLNSLDPDTCCGGEAYGVDDLTKRRTNTTNYHTDFGRIFNNSKNIRQSNRFIENRYTHGLSEVSLAKSGARYDQTYPSIDENGNAIIESGTPSFEKNLPYYGPFFQVDKFDSSQRKTYQQNTIKSKNGTCYSNRASVQIFPDCVTQYFDYKECETNAQKYITNQIPRLGIVYRGCNFEKDCSFDDQGRPLAGWDGGVPTSVDDLRRGLAGQEIYMYINLGNARGTVLENPPCSCVESVVGQQPPIITTIPSPVTFPSFPKYDLYPEQYGCRDKGWQTQHYALEGIAWSGDCVAFPESAYACNLRQPYTTYGYIRNLCGKESDDRRSVITNAFSSLIQTGEYRNTTPSSGTNVPMYWEFENPVAHESGITGYLTESGQLPFWGLADSTGRLVMPYFNTKIAAHENFCAGTGYYYDFDEATTWSSGWPTTHVPFLVEIDHDDSCVGCASVIMDSGNLNLTIESLDTSYIHGANGTQYGFTHCKYQAPGYTPTYDCNTGFNQACPNQSGLDLNGNDSIIYNEPHVGSTCNLSGDIALGVVTIEGTNIPIGWRSNAGGANSLVKLADASEVGKFLPPNFEVYGSFRLACESNHNYLIENRVSDQNIDFQQLGEAVNITVPSPLESLYSKTKCAHHYPSANADLKLDTRFMAIKSGIYDGFFQYMPEYALGGTTNPHNVFGGQIDIFTEENGRLWELVQTLVAENAMGCPSYLLVYGCYTYVPASSGEYGSTPESSGFYPCQGCSKPPGETICDCANITCDACGGIVSADGFADRRASEDYIMHCGCWCNHTLMKIIEVNGHGGITEIYNADTQTCNNCLTITGNTGPCGFVSALQASGERGVTPMVYSDFDGDLASDPIDILGNRTNFAYSPIVSTTSVSACNYHSGPNATTSGINYEINHPNLLSQGSTYCPTLSPASCEDSACSGDSNVGKGACGDPIPWSGAPPEGGVSLHKKSCYPEVMLVNKIECSGNYYKLYVDREYHAHNRQWYELQSIGVPPVPTCLPVQIGAYRNSGDCTQIPFATPSDSVTPVYHTEAITEGGVIKYYRGVCSNHPSSGLFVNQDFTFGPDPVSSGQDTLWNYFNLFYKQGFPSSKYHAAIDLGDPNADPVVPPDPCADGTVISSGSIFDSGLYLEPSGRYGIDFTNAQHSCLQDSIVCGGNFFCNKMFFPRQSYKTTTRVSKFGALALCTQDSKLETPTWYYGYESFNQLGTNVDILNEANYSRFVDVCDTSNISYLVADVGIDDSYILVDDYLPLIGVNPSLFRYTSDIKSCVIVGSGCSSEWLPTHSDQSILAGLHNPKTFAVDKKTSFGYYLDRTMSSGVDSCLFNPFKIYVDVECCSSNIRRKNFQTDDPTNLEYVVNGVPSWACNGLVENPPCECANTSCGQIPQWSGAQDNPYFTNDYADYPLASNPTYCLNLYLAYEIDYIPDPETVTFQEIYYICEEGSEPPFDHTTPIYDGQIVQCNGSPSISGCGPHFTQIWGYECGDYVYVPDIIVYPATAHDLSNFVVDPENPSDGSCCPFMSVCNVLGASFKLSKGFGAIRYDTITATSNSGEWRNCNCNVLKNYTTCEDAVIKAIITEV